MIKIYTTTDAGEIGALLDGKAKWVGFEESSLQDIYKLFTNGREIGTIDEFSIEGGQAVQESVGLTFNPYCVINCDDEKLSRGIISRLVRERLYVASLNGRGLENHFAPSKSEVFVEGGHFRK
jgi:hypothetical protein